MVDTMGMLLKVRVHSADIQDRDGGEALIDDALAIVPGTVGPRPGSERPEATPEPTSATPVEAVGSTPSSGAPDALPTPARIRLGAAVDGPHESKPGTRPTAVAPAGTRHLPDITKMWADGGYAGALEKHVLEKHGVTLEIVRRSDDRSPEMWVAPGETPTPRSLGFKLIKWRWIVERTFGWLGRSRRLSKDYEQRTDVSETWMHVGMSRLMLKRLTTAAIPAGASPG